MYDMLIVRRTRSDAPWEATLLTSAGQGVAPLYLNPVAALANGWEPCSVAVADKSTVEVWTFRRPALLA